MAGGGTIVSPHFHVPPMLLVAMNPISYLRLLMLGTNVHHGYCSQFVRLSVCLFVCYPSIYCLHKTLNFMQQNKCASQFCAELQRFSTRDFDKKLSLSSYSLFLIFSIAESAIFQCPITCATISHCTCIDSPYLKVHRHFCTLSLLP